MSQETLDLRRSIRIMRRHKLLMGVTVALGILAGGAYAVLKPSMVTSTALVLLSPIRASCTERSGGSRQRWARSLDGNPRGDCEKQSGARWSAACMSGQPCRSIELRDDVDDRKPDRVSSFR